MSGSSLLWARSHSAFFPHSPSVVREICEYFDIRQVVEVYETLSCGTDSKDYLAYCLTLFGEAIRLADSLLTGLNGSAVLHDSEHGYMYLFGVQMVSKVQSNTGVLSEIRPVECNSGRNGLRQEWIYCSEV